MTHAKLRERTAEFARRITYLIRPLLKSAEAQDAARQLRRAANGVASNYRAAGLGRSHAEFTSKLGVVLEEADESVYWLGYLRDTDLAAGPELLALLNEAQELTKIFSKSCQTAHERERGAEESRDRQRGRTRTPRR